MRCTWRGCRRYARRLFCARHRQFVAYAQTHYGFPAFCALHHKRESSVKALIALLPTYKYPVSVGTLKRLTCAWPGCARKLLGRRLCTICLEKYKTLRIVRTDVPDRVSKMKASRLPGMWTEHCAQLQAPETAAAYAACIKQHPTVCSNPGCLKPQYSRTLCRLCYRREWGQDWKPVRTTSDEGVDGTGTA